MRIATVLGVAFFGAASVHAQLVLDDYTTGSANYKVYSGSSYFTQSGSMVGGTRTEALAITANPFNNPLHVVIAGGFASLSEGTNVTSLDGIGYGYQASADNSTFSSFDLNLNLGSYTAFTLTVAQSQDAVSSDIELNSNPADDVTFTIAASATAQTYTIAFSSAGFAGVDFTHIHQIAIDFNDPAGSDFTLSSFQAAPEPMSYAFLGLGAIGLVARRRLRK